jgi:uncharacterized membrane protein
LGFHLYTWAFIVFSVLIVAIAAVLCFQRQFEDQPDPVPTAARFAGRLVVILGLVLCLVNFVAVTAECGVGGCPDDPTDYLVS